MRTALAPTLALACSLAFAGHASAHDVTFTGFAHGSQTVSFSVSSPNIVASGTVSAGGFATVLDGSPSFVTYCVDLYQHISWNTLYPEYTAPGTTHVFTNDRAYDDLGRLYAEAGVVNTSVEEAAFQMAVWEIAYEDSSNAYDLTSGAATFTGSNGAMTLAAGWLTGLGSGSGPGIEVIESRLHQDVIYAPVPEPETYALFLAGLGAVGFVARRRKS